jgi:hypothetical protein
VSRVTPPNGPPFDVDFVVRQEGESLRIKSVKRDVFGAEVEMVPVMDGRFHVAYREVGTFKGRYYTEPGMIFAFQVADGHARTLEMYGYDQTVIGRGELKH